jgi:hypothetical protein
MDGWADEWKGVKSDVRDSRAQSKNGPSSIFQPLAAYLTLYQQQISLLFLLCVSKFSWCEILTSVFTLDKG